MHLYILIYIYNYILSYFVCAVSLTHSLRLFKPHLAQHKYIINRHLQWMPLKLELFSCETTCILATVISTVSVRVAVTSLPAQLAIKGSARNWHDKVQAFFICHILNYTGYNQKWNVNQVRSAQWTVQKNKTLNLNKSNTTQEHIYKQNKK